MVVSLCFVGADVVVVVVLVCSVQFSVIQLKESRSNQEKKERETDTSYQKCF